MIPNGARGMADFLLYWLPARTQPLGGDFGEALTRSGTGPINVPGGATEQA